MGFLLVGAMFAALGATLTALFGLRSDRDAATVLVLFTVTLFLIPARMVLPGLGGAGTPAAVIGLFLAVWWLTSKILPGPQIAYGPQPLRPVLLLHAGWLLVTYAFAMRRPLTDIELPGADRGAIAAITLTAVALVAADGIRNRDRLEAVIGWIVGLGAVVALVGLVQFFTSVDPVTYIDIPGLVLNRELSGVGTRSIFSRPASTALHPIEFGVVAAMCLPLALYRLSTSSEELGQRVWRAGCLGLIATAAPITLSRSAIIGIGVGLVVYAIGVSGRTRLNLAVSAVLALIAARFAVPGLIGTLRNLFVNAQADPSIHGRLEDVDYVLDLLSVRPILGLGLGTVNPTDYRLLDNEYFGTALATGVPGLTLLIAVLATAIITGVQVGRRAQGAARRLAYALTASVSAATVALGTFDGFSFRIFTGLLFLLIGSIGALWRIERVGSRPATRSSGTVVAEGAGSGIDDEEPVATIV